MRRKDRELTDPEQMLAIIDECQSVHLGMAGPDGPYVVPMCFAFDGAVVYLHCAREGRKTDMLREDSRVCLEFSIPDGVKESSTPSGWSMYYRSVIATGRAEILTGREEKSLALEMIMRKYSGKEWKIAGPRVDGTCVIRIAVESMTGKVHSP